MYGHIEIMAKAVAEGARSANAEVVVKRVPDTMSPEVAKQYGAKLEQEAPFATPDELPQYDAIIFGTPTRFGNMAGQMRNFLDQTGSLWLNGALIGKVGSVFTFAFLAQAVGCESNYSHLHTDFAPSWHGLCGSPLLYS